MIMSEMPLKTFPSNEIEALTMLYLQNQDLSKLSPEEFFVKYKETYAKIKDCNSKQDTFNIKPLIS